jgi:O-antigen ligase
VAAVVMAVTSIGKRRWIYLGITVLLASGVIASATRTALAAFVGSLLVLAILQTRRAVIVIGVVLLVVGLAVSSPATTIGRGVRELGKAAVERDYQRLFSERLLPFLAAAEMTRDHPLLGVGPGCFRYHFMSYRVALATKYPAGWTHGFPMNWGTVHNDHLQVAAEAGVIGLLLFLVSLGVLAKRSDGDEKTRHAVFARTLRWPLVTAISVVCLAQFPLELAAPRLMFLTLGAMCVTWDRTDATS